MNDNGGQNRNKRRSNRIMVIMGKTVCEYIISLVTLEGEEGGNVSLFDHEDAITETEAE